MNSSLFSEIIQGFEKLQTKSERIEFLRKNYNPRFLEFLTLYFNKDVVFDVEIPDYKPSNDPAGLNVLYLHNELRRMYLFIKNHPKRAPNLDAKRQKNLLIQLLESLHKDEADLLVKLISRKLKIPYLTTKLLEESYPNIKF